RISHFEQHTEQEVVELPHYGTGVSRRRAAAGGRRVIKRAIQSDLGSVWAARAGGAIFESRDAAVEQLNRGIAGSAEFFRRARTVVRGLRGAPVENQKQRDGRQRETICHDRYPGCGVVP